MIRIDDTKLREVMKRRGYNTFEEVAAATPDLGVVTIYNMAANRNWTRAKLDALCAVLRCDPRDFVYFEQGADKNGTVPHMDAQPAQIAQ